MEEFILEGNGNFLKITFEEVYRFPENTSHFGGYDTRSNLEIYSDGFAVNSMLWISTGEIYEFYDQLLKTNTLCNGTAFLLSSEENLKFNVKYDVNGHVFVRGVFSKPNWESNILNFEFESDQSYIQATLMQLKVIANKYGGLRGIKS